MTQEAIQITETPPLPGVKLVQDMNKALLTIATDFAGPDDPAAKAGPYMTWADTATLTIKRRNAANSAWVIEGRLFRNHLPIIPLDEIPTTDIGPFVVAGKGIYEWDGAANSSKDARLDIAQTYSAPQRTTVTSRNDLNFDLSEGGNDYSGTPATVAVLTFANIGANAGKSGHIKIVNGSNYTIGAAATTKVKASSLSAISTTGTYLLAYWCDGTSVYITASSNLS